MFRPARTVAFAAALLATAGIAQPAHAQLGVTWVGVGEFDTEDVVFVMGGVSVSPRRQGWSPTGGVTLSWMQYPIGTGDRSAFTVTPNVGIKNSFGSGSMGLRVGYAIRSGNDEGGPIFADGGDDGFTTSGNLDYWGNGSWSAQALAATNWGAESFWGRGRLLKGFGRISVGPEFVYMSGNGYSATKIGGVVAFQPGPGVGIDVAVGVRNPSDSDFGEAKNATYFSAAIVLYPHD